MILKNIFAEKFRKQLAFCAQTAASFCKNLNVTLFFLEKRQFFRRKWQKIVIISESKLPIVVTINNIDPLVLLIFLLIHNFGYHFLTRKQ
jgi:GTP-sensing pleiotropic transcriptional regulator CodY